MKWSIKIEDLGQDQMNILEEGAKAVPNKSGASIAAVAIFSKQCVMKILGGEDVEQVDREVEVALVKMLYTIQLSRARRAKENN